VPLKLIQRPDSPNWHIHGTLKGVRIRESTGLTRRADAEAELAKRSKEILDESLYGSEAVRTFAEAALSYLEAGGSKLYLLPLVKHFGNTKLVKIGAGEIAAAAKAIKKPGTSPSTIKRQIYTPTLAVLNHAAKLGWCRRPIVDRPKEPQGRVRWISHTEAEKLILAAGPHLKPLVTFLLCTGCRLSEALYLDWSSVDLEAAHAVILNVEAGGIGTKNGDSRGIPLQPRVVEALSGLPHRDGKVFRRSMRTRKDGTVEVGAGYEIPKRQGGGQIKTAWRGMCKRAGITNFTPHDCRHTWATWHYAANRDLTALMVLGGWKDIKMVVRYSHVNTGHLADGQAKAWAATTTE
jgi:integrase